jgi:muramoyltetrapeptide carboxypeptidase
MIIPPYLKIGDTIAIICPAGYMALEKVTTCIKLLQQQGYKVLVSKKTIGSSSKTYFSATDAVRKAELQKYLDDKNVKAILCGRGGYGMGRIIDGIDFTQFCKSPKWLIGFSDITLLHNHVHKNFGIATMHASMAAAFDYTIESKENIETLLFALQGKKIDYVVAPHKQNKLGKVRGQLVGGNLSLLANAVGTASDINTKNKILCIEEIGEYIYAADRMLHQLKRAGKLANLKALLIGDFSDMKDTDRPFGKTIYEAIKDLVAEYNYPVAYSFPLGHDDNNLALKFGVTYNLEIDKKLVTLTEV